jgi:2-polyprenyl-3-methyl-5-hydroxy-6-metoxy-1,4-benzoquinol methylase
VGCGEGLLAQRLAAVSRSVIGVDSDPASVWRASERSRFETFDADQQSFDLSTFVASIHH